jgi:hypothetical protein
LERQKDPTLLKNVMATVSENSKELFPRWFT